MQFNLVNDLDLGSGVAGGARGWVAGRAGLWGVPPTWVWVVGFSPQIVEHPTSICNTGVKCILLISNHMIFLVQFGINKTPNCTCPMGSCNFV